MKFFQKILFLSIQISWLFAFEQFSINDLLKEGYVEYDKYSDEVYNNFEQFPLSVCSEQQPHDVIIAESFLLKIKQGTFCTLPGISLLNNKIISELVWQQHLLQNKFTDLQVSDLPCCEKYSGTVVVLSPVGCPASCYYCAFTETCARLYMIKNCNITYDWIYIPDQCFLMNQYKRTHLEDLLTYFEIDLNKIIYSSSKELCLQADEIIVPSFVSRIIPYDVRMANYLPIWAVKAIRSIGIEMLEQKNEVYNFSKKIFISRQDACERKVLNENELFEQLQHYGFERFVLSDLSLVEQIALFSSAEHIVGVHGAGLVNLLFTKPGVQLFEIFQARLDATYWYLGQMLGLQHYCFKTEEFDEKGGYFDTIISQRCINKIVEEIKKGL